MTPLAELCACYPLFAASVCLLYAALNGTSNQCHYLNFLHHFLFTIFESKDDDCLHFMFTTNNRNICVTMTGMSLLLHPHFERRFPLVASHFPLSVFLKFVFVIRARQNTRSIKSLPGMLMFCWLFLFPAKGIWKRTNVRGQDNNSGVFWGRRSDCWLWSVGLCR